MRLWGRAVASVGTAVMALAATTSGAASASTAGGAAPAGEGHWHRYHQQDFVVPAMEACAFRVAAHVLYDREYFRTISHYSGGNPRVQLFRGPLII